MSESSNQPAPTTRSLVALAVGALHGLLGACQPMPDPELEQPAVRMTEYLTRILREDREVGFQYVVFNRDGVVFEFAGGVADAKTRMPVDMNTTFMLASTTKVLTSAAILRLVDRGTVGLDVPLAQYLSQQPYGEQLTVRQLLNHTSGVPNPLPLDWVHTRQTHEGFDEADTLRQVLARNSKLDHAPGSKYAYSNVGYWLLGEVVARASGRSFCEFVREEVLFPLDITPAELGCDVFDWDSHARGHLRRHSLMGWLMPWMTSGEIWDEPQGAWSRFASLYMNGMAYGGMMGNAKGVARFGRDLLRERSVLLSEESKAALFAQQYDASGQAIPVTLGWHVGNLQNTPYFSKPGGGPGFSSNLRLYPGLGLGAVFLSNLTRVSESDIQAVSDVWDAPFVIKASNTSQAR